MFENTKINEKEAGVGPLKIKYSAGWHWYGSRFRNQRSALRIQSFAKKFLLSTALRKDEHKENEAWNSPSEKAIFGCQNRMLNPMFH